MVAYPTGFNKVTIANMALSAIGARSTISSFLENSAEANQVNLWYEFCRLQVLQAFNWAFARRRAILVESTEDPPEGIWGYRYLIPSDCVVIRSLENPVSKTEDAVPFDIEESPLGVKTLVTDLAEAKAIYTSTVSDVTMFTPLFIDALAAYIGFRIAVPLTGDRSVRADMGQEFRVLMMVAPAHDANESVADPPRDADWIRGRN